MTPTARPFVLACLTVVLVACGEPPGSGRRDPIRGAWYAEHGQGGLVGARSEGQLDHMRAVGIDWIALGPEASMARVDRPEIAFGSNDAQDRAAIRLAHAKGFRVMLCPRIECPSFFRAEAPEWRGDIRMRSLVDWDSFHHSLQELCVHYGTMAQEEHVALFCLGLEYRRSTRDFPERWRSLVDAVREVYRGPLTYSANWHHEFEEIRFWEALDFIGVGAYFPVASAADASEEQIRAGWVPALTRLESVSRRWGRPVLLTEIGYPTFADAASRPWEWTHREGKILSEVQQADCFRAFFKVTRGLSWYRGCFLWRYHSDTRWVEPWEYSPQGKRAEDVIRAAWSR